MAATLLLDIVAWDLVLDASRNIAVAAEPYSLAQDSASAIKTFEDECYFDTTVGIPYTFGPIAPGTLKQQYIAAALTVPDVVNAQVFFNGITQRALSGQVQVYNASGQSAVAAFATPTSPTPP